MSVFVGDAGKRRAGFRRANFRGIGSGIGEPVPNEIAIVLDDERSAVGNVVEEALVGAGQFGAKFVGADTDNGGANRERSPSS